MIDFNTLSPNPNIIKTSHQTEPDAILRLWQGLYEDGDIISSVQAATSALNSGDISAFIYEWQAIQTANPNDDKRLTDWLIRLFNAVFDNPALAQMSTRLVRGGDAPEYFPADSHGSARIEFAHGFFASCLHEISHWCVAGAERRKLNDFGYWYEADGRNEAQQRLFEKVEIKPQAIECLMTLAANRYFYVSQDNLNADFDTADSTFAEDVYEKAAGYLAKPYTLPRDAKRCIWLLLHLCQKKYRHITPISQ